MKASRKARTPRSALPKKAHGSLYRRTRPLVRMLRFFGTVMLCYLMHVSVMPYIQFNGISPNLLLASGAIMAVAYTSRLRVFWAGAIFGILTETMSQTVDLMNLIIYPILLTVFAFAFGDPSEAKQEAMRGREHREMSVYLRTIFCVICMAAIYETVNVLYVYLRGIEITTGHYTRALTSMLSTLGLTVVAFFPVRALLGFPRPRRKPKAVRGRYVAR